MAGSLNKVMLVGNVGADPEIKSLNSGDRVANLRIATSESWKDKQTGEKKEVTEWHRVVVFGDGLVGIIERYVTKGSKVLVEGALKTRKWEKDGQDHYQTEVVLKPFNGTLLLLGDKGGGDRGDGGGYSGGGQSSGSGQTGQTKKFSADLDDEIPF